MSTEVFELAEEIKEKGQASPAELPKLLKRAQQLAGDNRLDIRTRALAHRAAANAHQLLNQFQPALENYDVAAALFETIDEPVELGRTLHAKVGMLFTLSRFDELFECSDRARQLFERCGDLKRVARLDVNLAHAYHRLGRPREALECSERALLTLEQTADPEGFIAAAINSAVTLTAMHDFERAEERYRSAMRLAAELGMALWVRLTRYNLAYLRYLKGDTATALEELRVLRHEYQETHEEWMTCHCWLDESEILLEIGDLDGAIVAARHARSIGNTLGLNAEMARSLLYEATATLRCDSTSDEANALLEEAAQRFDVERDQISSAAARLQTALLRSDKDHLSALRDALSARDLLRDSGLPHRRALAEIVVGRIQRAMGNLDEAANSFKSGLVLAENSRSDWMQFHAAYELGVSLREGAASEATALFRRAEGLLDSLWNRLGSDDLKMTFLADRENVYTHLVRSSLAESTSVAFDYSEKARSRVLRELLLSPEAPTSIAGLQTGLSRNEVVIEYFISGNDLYIFVLRQDAASCVQREGVVSRLQSEWEHLDRHIESCSVKWEYLDSVRGHLQETAQQHLRNFYTELIAPIESELRETIIFVPHGFLHHVPLHALHDGQYYVSERFRVAYSPNASLYCSPAPVQTFDRPLLIAFCSNPSSRSIEEVQEVSQFVEDAEVVVNPSIQELRMAFATPRELVHIAGHAGIDAIKGRFSWIETPEGRLTSSELTNMRIRTRTLVITGCRTARRLIRPGDEWLGLMRSFYLSGASTIVSALWDIRDDVARTFGPRFHQAFTTNDALTALKMATTDVRQERPHPYFWAGFGVFVRRLKG